MFTSKSKRKKAVIKSFVLLKRTAKEYNLAFEKGVLADHLRFSGAEGEEKLVIQLAGALVSEILSLGLNPDELKNAMDTPYRVIRSLENGYIPK